MTEYAIILVFSTSHAIQAERVLRQAGIGVKLIPTPRQLSSDCGSALRIALNERERAAETLQGGGVEIDRIETLVA
jgi:hypothetical protein